MADDYAPHKSPNVFRLCWQRGYVLIAHGGGNTPVAQTCDTDLNQHVKREYADLETRELISQFRETAVAVPRVSHETAIDMMYKIMSKREMHLRAAAGYKKTGATVALDGSEDNLIEREAGTYWQSLSMRTKVNKEIEMVRQEFEAGRLRWTQRDVARLINPYPEHKKEDGILERQQEYSGHEAAGSDEEDGDEAAVADEEDGDEAAVAAESDSESSDSDLGQHKKQIVEVPAKEECKDIEVATGLSLVDEEHLVRSRDYAATLEATKEELKKVGALSVCVSIDHEIDKERRRMRALSKQNTAVADALAIRRDAEEAKALQKQRLLQDAQADKQARNKLQQEAAVAASLLKKRKQELAELENVIECRQTMKRFTPDQLGQGKAKGGGLAVRKLRFEVLDRMSKVGAGLSAAQRNEFAWFKEAWDSKMREEHDADWGSKFANWIQGILQDHENNVRNSFSLFVQSETQRVLVGTPALLCP